MISTLKADVGDPHAGSLIIVQAASRWATRPSMGNAHRDRVHLKESKQGGPHRLKTPSD